MKKFLTLFTLTLLFAFISTNAQPWKVAVFTGYGQTAYENITDQAGYVPIGLQAAYGFENMKWGAVTAGIEFNYAVAKPTFELQSGGTKIAEQEVDQMVIAALIKVKFLKKQWNPFVRVGAGMYMGDIKNTMTTTAGQPAPPINLPSEVKLKSAFGFNIGGGVDYNLSKTGALFLEFVYHIVSREPDAGGTSSGFNNWAIQLGYQFAFGK
jgi:opacity protein-like surface antigen